MPREWFLEQAVAALSGVVDCVDYFMRSQEPIWKQRAVDWIESAEWWLRQGGFR